MPPAALTITANNASKTYGQTKTFAGTEFTTSALQNGESVGSVTLSSPGAAATAGVGNSPYAITARAEHGAAFDPANYAIPYVDGRLTVNPAALTIRADDVVDTLGSMVIFTGTPLTLPTPTATAGQCATRVELGRVWRHRSVLRRSAFRDPVRCFGGGYGIASSCFPAQK